jgi:hypothetical protein
MTTQKNTLHSSSHYAHLEKKSPLTQQPEVDVIINNFVSVYNGRATFFTDKFIKKVQAGNRKALCELQRHALPPTQMDLRHEFAKCVKANIADSSSFQMNDGKIYTMQDLRRLVPEWASIAEKALMESDPALADKLMSRAQWNAKAAFEVAFVNAMNELRDIKELKPATTNPDHYMRWIINPLEKAIENVNAVRPPGNSLIGYGDRISLAEAMATAATLKDQFDSVGH